MKIFAERDNARGADLSERGEYEQAEIYLRKAIDAAPKWSVPWYNLGLLYKRTHKWQESLECNQRAVEFDPKDEAAWWNLGIAATALGKWRLARQAWQVFGLDAPITDDEVLIRFGSTPIRINSREEGEVVWCYRIDFARAIIKSVPLPESEHRFEDLLLHDGAPNGYRKSQGKQVPVFDEIQILKPSEYSTFQAIIRTESQIDIEDLISLAFENEMGAENWQTIRLLCEQCSRGIPHEHDAPTYEAFSDLRIGIAAKPRDDALRLLESWSISHSASELKSFEQVL